MCKLCKTSYQIPNENQETQTKKKTKMGNILGCTMTWITDTIRCNQLKETEMVDLEQVKCYNYISQEVTKIQANFKGYLTRKIYNLEKMSKRLNLPIIKYHLPEPNRFVEVLGNFTDPKWKLAIRMKFCSIQRLYYSDYILHSYNQSKNKLTLKFNFLVDGKFQLSTNYQSHKGKVKTYNLITLNQIKNNRNKFNVQRLKRKWPENQYNKIGNAGDQQQEENKSPLSLGAIPAQLSQSPILGPNQASFMLQMQSAGFMIPNPKTRTQNPDFSGDFMYIGKDVCGVADGVSQWKSFKINPRQFTEQLLQNACEQLEFNLEIEKESTWNKLAINALKNSFESVKNPGSSTVIFYFIRDSMLHTTYIGDSQIIILRPLYDQNEEITGYTLIFKSKPNQYQFNAPCQLIKWPDQYFVKSLEPNLSKKLNALIQSASTGKVTQPEDSVQRKVPVKGGDIIICGSDGFFDNLSDKETCAVVLKEHKKGVQHLAEVLTKLCWENSMDEFYESPFQKEARKHNKMYYGGKPDDCTVVVSKVLFG